MDKPIILVVDDEKKFADRVVKVINQTQKYEAIPAYSAPEALEQLKKRQKLFGWQGNKIRLVLLDIKMPEIDGLQLLKKIRTKYADDQMGVIMITAFEDEEKWDKATDNFVAGYILKPYTNEDLLSKIDRFFSSAGAFAEMTLETFEKHMDKTAELKRKGN